VPILHAVWDANLYRGLSDERFEQLAHAERSKSIVAMANFTVAGELLARSASRTGVDFHSSAAAARRLSRHTSRRHGKDTIFDFVIDADRVVAHALFGVAPSNPLEDLHVYANTIGDLARATKWEDLLARSQRVAEVMRRRSDRMEADFTTSLFRNVVQTVNPNAKSWADAQTSGTLRDAVLASTRSGEGLIHTAESVVQHSAATIGKVLSASEIQTLAELVLKNFPVPLYALTLLVERILADGTDMTRRSRPNSVWDIQIAYSTATTGTLNKVPVWLITNDSLLQAAAKRALSTRILSLADYELRLSQSWECFRDDVSRS
jgi:hypothetical protein